MAKPCYGLNSVAEFGDIETSINFPRSSLIATSYDATVEYSRSICAVQKESRETQCYVIIVGLIRKNDFLSIPHADRNWRIPYASQEIICAIQNAFPE